VLNALNRHQLVQGFAKLFVMLLVVRFFEPEKHMVHKLVSHGSFVFSGLEWQRKCAGGQGQFTAGSDKVSSFHAIVPLLFGIFSGNINAQTAKNKHESLIIESNVQKPYWTLNIADRATF
jgi:hypothetical protein